MGCALRRTGFSFRKTTVFIVMCFARTGLLSFPIRGKCFFAMPVFCRSGFLPLPILKIAPYVMLYFSRSEMQRSRAGLKVTPGGKMVKQAPLLVLFDRLVVIRHFFDLDNIDKILRSLFPHSPPQVSP